MDNPVPPLRGRPDIRTRTPRFAAASLIWLGIGAVVGLIGILVVLQIQDRSGRTPPTSTFAAAAIVISLVAIVTVAAAARSAGASWRAAIALAGGFIAIAVAKFGIGPTALFQGNQTDVIQNAGGVSSGGMVVVIAIAVGCLYLAAIWVLAVLFRPAGPPDGPNGNAALALLGIGLAALLLTGIVTTAASQYVTWATTGLEATGLAVALFVAAGLVAAAFHETSVRAKALGHASMYMTVLWVAIAFLLVFQVLWIVFLLAIVATWPFRSVTPK